MSLQDILQQIDWSQLITILTLLVSGGFIISYGKAKNATIENLKEQVEFFKTTTPDWTLKNYEALKELYGKRVETLEMQLTEYKESKEGQIPEPQKVQLDSLILKAEAVRSEIKRGFIFTPKTSELLSDSDAILQDKNVDEDVKKSITEFQEFNIMDPRNV